MRVSHSCCTIIALCWALGTDIASANCIAVITTGGGQQFWHKLKAGALAAGEQLHIPVHVRGPIDELNLAGQKQLIQQLLGKGCNGLVLAPNSDAHHSTINDLKLRGIPTVFIDRDAVGERISVIKTNNYAAGKMAAREMINALKGKGKIAVLRSHQKISSTTDREQGFITTARAAGLKVIADQYLGVRVGEARTNAYHFLSVNKDLDGIFTPNESTTVGAIKALEHFQRNKRFVHIGFDASSTIIKAVQAGKLYGFMLQRPFEMSYQGVLQVHNAINGIKVPEVIDTGVVFINQYNIDALLMD